MSTRCVVSVMDGGNCFHIYRHCDGYPGGKSGVINEISQAFPFAWDFPRFEAMDFAAALVRAWKSSGGGNIYLTEGPDRHGDLEYHYEVTERSGQLFITVYKIEFGSEEGKLHFSGTLEECLDHYSKV